MHEDQEFLALSRTFRIVDGLTWETVEAAQPMAGGGCLTIGQVVDAKYRIDALLGEGGMGSVYSAQHLLLNKKVALKTFRSEGMTSDSWDRFQREAQSIAKLTHVNIVQVFDFGIGPGNVPYYTMELLNGQSLAGRLKDSGRMELTEALPILRAVASALGHAHKIGIVHRDIKPANIFLDQDKSGRVVAKVVDFGIAKLATSHAEVDRKGQSQTDSDLVFGSPLYMSPEQAMGHVTDHRTDIYSFGCTVYEGLTGKPPFVGKNAFDTIRMHTDKKAPYLVESAGGTTFSRAAEALVAGLLAKNVTDRYQDFDQVSIDLKNLADTPAPNSSLGPIGRVEAKLQDTSLSGIDTTGGEPLARPRGKFNGGILAAIIVLLVGTAVCTLIVQGRLLRPGGRTLAMKSPSPLQTASQPAPISTPRLEITGDPKAPAYYSMLTEGGVRIFYFPTNEFIGTISLNGRPPEKAQGMVTVAPGTVVRFVPAEPFLTNPEMFAHFRPEDLQQLEFSTHLSWTDKHIEAATRYLTGLTDIELGESGAGGTVIDYINRLPNLDSIDVSLTKISGADLCRLKRLPVLIGLHATGIADISPMLTSLKNCQSVRFVTFNEDHLTTDDMANIGTMKNIEILHIRDNMITPEGLLKLDGMTHLRYISMNSPLLNCKTIKKFPYLPILNTLELLLGDDTPANCTRLQSLLPKNCKIMPAIDHDMVTISE